MGKFKKKKDGELPQASTAALPDIVFMLLFFFMTVTVMKDKSLLVENKLPAADDIEKLNRKNDRVMYIYAGKPVKGYEKFGTEAVLQLNDKIAHPSDLKQVFYLFLFNSLLIFSFYRRLQLLAFCRGREQGRQPHPLPRQSQQATFGHFLRT